MNYSTIKRIGLTTLTLACISSFAAPAAFADTASDLSNRISSAIQTANVPTSQIAIHVNGDNDEVQLCGFVTDDQAKAANKAAEDAAGDDIKVVDDLISTESVFTKIRANDKADVKNIQSAVNAKVQTLGKNVANSTAISAQTYRGIVELCGYVNDKKLKNDLGDAVKDVSGITKVHNNITVE